MPANSTVLSMAAATSSYGYYGSKSKHPGGATPTLPGTNVGEPLLFLVDFDAGKIYVKGEENATPVLLHENIVIPSEGMRPVLDLYQASSAKMNFAGPFDVNLPAGYIPWGGNYLASAIPTLSFDSLSEDDEYLEGDAIDFSITATDTVDGNISNNVIYTSSRDGVFDSEDALSPGFHKILATVTNSRGVVGYTVVQKILVQPLETVLEVSLNNRPSVTLNEDKLEVSKTGNSWGAVFGNSVRKTGKYAFQLTPLTMSGSDYGGLGIVPANSTTANGLQSIAGAYGYHTQGMQVVGNNSGSTVIDPMYPVTPANQSVLFMVDFDAGTIRLRGEENSASVLMLKDLQFAAEGMRPAVDLYSTTTLRVNFSGPFTIPLEAGYQPWGSTESPASIPQVSISSPAEKFKIAQTSLPFTISASATDLEDGSLTSNIVYSSNIDGPFVSTSSLSPGIHLITASVTDSDGNVGGDSIVVTVDTQVSVAVDTTFNSTTGISFTGTGNLTAERSSTNTAWAPFYLNKVRNTGKYAFEYKQLAGAAATSIAGIVPANQFGGTPGAFRNSFAYINNARKYTNNAETNITSPDTLVNETLLVMVDLDAGTVRIRGTNDSTSTLLFSGLVFPDQGMRPGFAVRTLGTKIQVNASWPFTIPVDAGYLPWDYTNNLAPKLELTWPGAEARDADPIAFSGQALDYEDGSLSSAITWTSSRDGLLGTGSIAVSLSKGDHLITASVTDSTNNTTAATSFISVVANGVPKISISSPADGATVDVGDPVSFAATATDLEDGNLSSTIQWRSDKDGVLGTGAALNLSTLTAGLHVISASATDTESGIGISRKTIQVGAPPPVAEYSHNALGQRVIKTDADTNTTLHFIYDQEGQVIAEIDAATGDTLREYIYLHGQQVAIVDNTDTSGEERYFVHNDNRMTPQKITNESQVAVWAADYEPFGKATVVLSTIDNNIRLPGQYSDVESGLHYNYFRDYDPDTGRYIESDPIGLEGGLNTYGYVEGNPNSNIDPTGEFLNVVVGGATSVAAGYLIAKLSGDECYNWKSALVDFSTGAVGAGVVSKINKLNRITHLRKLANERGLQNQGTKNTIETWAGNGEKLKIKHSPSRRAPGPGSRVPRFEYKTGAGRYWDPFTGATGRAGNLSHVPLEPFTPRASALSGGIGAAATPTSTECTCNE